MLAIASPDFHLTSAAKCRRRPRSGGLKGHANIKMMKWSPPGKRGNSGEAGIDCSASKLQCYVIFIVSHRPNDAHTVV